MKAQGTYDDVNLILRLYELRREERMRQARSWFVASFQVRTMEEFNELCPVGSEENANVRMVLSYWDMVASFITAGILHQELFFQSGREMLFAWERTRELIPQMREGSKDPSLAKNLETVCTAYIGWMNSHSPDAYGVYQARVRGM